MGTGPGDIAYFSIEAGASVGATGAAAVFFQRDCVVAGPAASIYSYTLSRELPGGSAGAPGLFHATVTGTTSGLISVANTSNLVKAVATFNDAGAATDKAHDFMAMRVL